MKKTCGKCKESKPISEFHSANKGADKLQSYCKKCALEQTRVWQRTHKNTTSEYSYEYARRPQARYLFCIRNAKRRNIGFSLTQDEFFQLIAQDCYYCEGMFDKNKTGFGIDRIDNSFGYRPNNCLPCCTICNKIKNNFLTVEETKVAIQAIMGLRGYKRL